MGRPISIAILLAAGSMALSGQRILVFSEYQRVMPDGGVAKADRVERRREILSPAVARNAYVTFRVAVEVPSGSPYTMYIAQNPENSVKVDLYQEQYSRLGEEWVPDRVKAAEQPVNAVLSEGQKVQTYLLDVFVPETTPAGRFRLEIQLYAQERWLIYPLEVRAQAVVAGAKAEPRGPLPALGARSDAGVTAVLRQALCGKKSEGGVAALDNARAFLVRNARQDLQIAAGKQRETSKEMVEWQMVKAGGWASTEAMCGSQAEAPQGAEWWLRARGYLYQGLAVK